MVLGIILALVVAVSAEISAELPYLQTLQNPTTVGLSGGSLYHVLRTGESGGPSAGAGFWHPQAYQYFSPWNADFNAIRINLGNEVGDMLYQEMVRGPELGNRTPTMRAQISTPAVAGWRGMVNFAQNDHYGERWRNWRAQQVAAPNANSADHRWAWFGENYPGYSSVHGGVQGLWGYDGGAVQIGRDYAWQLGASGAWQGEKHERIEAQGQWDTWVLQAYVQNSTALGVGKGNDGELRDYYLALQWVHCGFQVGLTARKLERVDNYPWLWDESALLQPWFAVQKLWGAGGRWSVWASGGDQWQVSDTLQWHSAIPLNAALNLQLSAELRTAAASKFNPLAPDAELLGADTIVLQPGGYGWVQDALLKIAVGGAQWQVEASVLPWAEKGGLAFAATDFSHNLSSGNLRDLPFDYRRFGNMERQGLWWGMRQNIEIKVQPSRHELFAGFNHENRQFNTLPDWEAPRYFAYGGARVAALPGMTLEHSWQYVGASYWHHWANTSFRIAPHWVWHAAIKQEFAEPRLSLEAAWLGVLAEDRVLMPQGNEDRSRFMAFLTYRF